VKNLARCTTCIGRGCSSQSSIGSIICWNLQMQSPPERRSVKRLYAMKPHSSSPSSFTVHCSSEVLQLGKPSLARGVTCSNQAVAAMYPRGEFRSARKSLDGQKRCAIASQNLVTITHYSRSTPPPSFLALFTNVLTGRTAMSLAGNAIQAAF
jgi:hypothetical protein